MTTSHQLRRLLAVLPQLADGIERSYEAIADRVGVNWEMIRDDLYALSERQSDPGGFVEEVQLYFGERGVRAFSSQFQRPMRITMGELGALELGLAMIRGERPPEEHRAIDRARERLRQMTTRIASEDPPLATRHAQAAAGDSLYLARVSDAMRRNRRVRIEYRSSGREMASSRSICPLGVVAARGQWYVVAHCDISEGIRIFRLDRIEGVEALDETFEPPPGFTMDDVVREDRVFHADALDSMRVRYAARIAKWIAEHETGEVQADGSIVVEHPVADIEWAVRHALQYGPAAEVLAPPSVREELVERLRSVSAELGS